MSYNQFRPGQLAYKVLKPREFSVLTFPKNETIYAKLELKRDETCGDL